ncbi:protein arginine N-methyltransferase 3-like protein [Dinothrombium tinctorium]|uniref:type I protein arginine methyltransferase n=1 Tax=Dinothrombium tinctorium TaxID=1965070 RepID=A0A3S3PWR2_9ACAR|nr:protein arginine N-methyltransferase 3-like protein [Dinothrombium tinctorium]
MESRFETNANCSRFDESSGDEIEPPFDDHSLQSICLFCPVSFECSKLAFDHIAHKHGVDFIAFCVEHRFDCFSFIKLINFIRAQNVSAANLNETIAKKQWLDDRFMKPALENDALLTFDIEEYTETTTKEKVELNDELNRTLKVYNERLAEIKSEMNSLIEDKYHESSESNINVSKLNSEEDSYYFTSYSHFSIHHDMLSDRIRTLAYKDAIMRNKNLFQATDVLDIGCGTGILSLFAASNECNTIVAVDKSDIIYNAMDIAQENGLLDKIKFMKGKLEDLSLQQKFDIIISEWMGYFLIFEGMLDTVLYARDNFLKPNGILLPNRCTLNIAGVSDEAMYKKYYLFWNDVYGFKMSCMKNEYIKEVGVEVVPAKNVTTDTFMIKELDLMRCSLRETQFIESRFEVKCQKQCRLTAFIVWFDCFFDSDKLEHKVTLSTSPHSEATHWKQCILPLQHSFSVQENEIINGAIEVRRNKKDIRSLLINLKINDKESLTYSMQ